MKMVVAILLISSLTTEGVHVPPELIANVSMLLANFHEVDCVQIFRTDNLPFSKVEEIHKMWKTLAVVESKVTTGIYTYKHYLERKVSKARKVSCYRSLKIMSDDEESRVGYAEFSKCISIKDAIWVLYTDSFSVQFFQHANVVFNDVIIIAEIKSEELILLHEVYKIRPDHPLKVLPLGRWTRAQGLQIPNQLMYDRRKDLEGAVVRTASRESWPASYLRNGEWKGFLIQLWKEIESLINCTSVTVNKGHASVVGMNMGNNTWSGLIGMTLNDEVDVILSEVIIDKERSKVLNFFHPIMKTSFQVYTRHLGYKWRWDSILRPFHANVWAATVTWVLVATLFWTFTHRICIYQGLGSMDFGKSPLDSFFFVLQALSQQGYYRTPTSYACRILFFVSYAVSSVLIPSYSASLVSILSQKIHLQSFPSLKEMVDDGTYRLIVRDSTAQHALFAHSKQDFFKRAYEKLVKPVPESVRKLSIEQSMRALCRLDNYAVVGVEEIVESRVRHRGSLDCPVVPLSHPVSTIYVTMAAAKNSPYWGLINHHLGKLINMGIVERLKRSAFPLGSSKTPHMKDSEVEVGMQQVVSAFLFIGGFTVISFFILILEVQYTWLRTLKNRPKRKNRALRWGPPKGTRFGMKLRGKLQAKPPVTSFPNFSFQNYLPH